MFDSLRLEGMQRPLRARSHARTAALTARVVSAQAWDAAVLDFDDLEQEQLHAFATARGTFAAIEPLLFLRRDEIVGGALVGVRRLPLGIASVAVIKWGPMLRDASSPEAQELFAEMVQTIVAEYGDCRRMAVSVLSRPSLSEPNARLEMLYELGFRKSTTWEWPEQYVLNLRQDDQTMRSNLGRKWRGHLNKAERSELSFVVSGPQDLAKFDALYKEMLSRKKFSDLTDYHTLAAVMAGSEDRLRPRLFFVTQGGRDIAAAVIFIGGDRVTYIYGATSAAALSVNAGHFLHWNIARWLRDNTRAGHYVLGGTDGVSGLYEFKTGLAGATGIRAVVPPTAVYASSLRARALTHLAFRMRDFLGSARHHAEGVRGLVRRLRAGKPGPEGNSDSGNQN